MVADPSRFKVLFLCTGNSCRSQMAEGWAAALVSDVIEPYSAGTNPQGLNRLAVRVMSEVGVNISRQQSKHVDSLRDIAFDFVVTVCDAANETCPILPSTTKVIHQSFDDPPRLAMNSGTEEAALSHYRRVRDEIRSFVSRLPERLKIEAARKTAANRSKDNEKNAG